MGQGGWHLTNVVPAADSRPGQLIFTSRAGAVLYQTGVRKCSNLGGLFRTMPVTTICGTIGALAISAFPWTSGFISKSMISSAAAYEHMAWVWYLLVAASATLSGSSVRAA